MIGGDRRGKTREAGVNNQHGHKWRTAWLEIRGIGGSWEDWKLAAGGMGVLGQGVLFRLDEIQ